MEIAGLLCSILLNFPTLFYYTMTCYILNIYVYSLKIIETFLEFRIIFMQKKNTFFISSILDRITIFLFY